MVAVPVAFAVAMALFASFFMHNVYAASTSLYVLANQEQDSSSNQQSDLSAAQMISNDVAKLFEMTSVLKQSAADVGLEDLDDFNISVSSESTSRVIDLTVSGSSAKETAAVANAIAANVSELAQQAMNVQSVNVIERAEAPAEPSGPNRPFYVVVAFVIGLVVAEMVVYLREVLNTRIRTPEELEARFGIPVIGRVPYAKDMK